MTANKKYKYRLEYKGEVVAESDWSSILFAQKNKRPASADKYRVINNATGRVAGTK
jgi:hypothetical protein